MRILLHACCGPCFLGTKRVLDGEKGLEYALFSFNPNIGPGQEHERRFSNLAIAAERSGVGLIDPGYEPGLWEGAVAPVVAERGDRSFPDRCIPCYRVRLERTAREARARGFDAFSTTLLVSPWQRHDDLATLGREVGEAAGVEFMYMDFRPGFRAGQEDAKAMGLYRQKYCGCALSLEGR